MNYDFRNTRKRKNKDYEEKETRIMNDETWKNKFDSNNDASNKLLNFRGFC